MKTGRPKKHTIVVSPLECEQLESYARSRALPHALVRRSNIVLMSARGHSNTGIAKALQVSAATVSLWRRRFLAHRIAGLYTEVRAERPRTYDDEAVARLIQRALTTKPKEATHWSARSFARATGVSKSTVQRYFALFGLQPHRTKGFKLSNDPFFVEKVRDIVGLYLNPPEKALVLSVDEKTQVQALERSQPVLPMGLGYLEGVYP